jgi:hypothetical protein
MGTRSDFVLMHNRRESRCSHLGNLSPAAYPIPVMSCTNKLRPTSQRNLEEKRSQSTEQN